MSTRFRIVVDVHVEQKHKIKSHIHKCELALETK